MHPAVRVLATLELGSTLICPSRDTTRTQARSHGVGRGAPPKAGKGPHEGPLGVQREPGCPFKAAARVRIPLGILRMRPGRKIFRLGRFASELDPACAWDQSWPPAGFITAASKRSIRTGSPVFSDHVRSTLPADSRDRSRTRGCTPKPSLPRRGAADRCAAGSLRSECCATAATTRAAGLTQTPFATRPRGTGAPQAELHRVALERVDEARHCRVIHQFPSATARTRRPCHETPSSGASSGLTGTSSDLGRLTPKLLNSPQI